MMLEAGSFSRIAAQTAKQVIIQKVREAEREGVYNEFKDRVGEIVNGIVRRYERGDLKEIQPFLAEDGYESFIDGVAAGEDQGLTIDANFIGVREMELVDARLDDTTKEAEMTIRFVCELTS